VSADNDLARTTVAMSRDGLPSIIGKYRVLRQLGEGATSAVYLARDDFHQRDVAIKLAHTGAGRSAMEKRFSSHFFAAEADLVGRLNHPNVVQILDAVNDPVAPYLVMEYVPGVTLREFCTADRLLPLEQVVEIGFKCAMALGYVYRQGIIHRDVKPANILTLMNDNDVVDIKLSDFGSAFNQDADKTQIHRVGSLAYMSPEQLDGATLDCRADIYALAAVLYHLIAGRPPFEAETQGALLHQIWHGEPASLVGCREGVSPALDTLICRALGKTREERPADWDQFAHALSELIAKNEVPRGRLQQVMDSERFTLLRSLAFFDHFDDAGLWEVVHRARWQRFHYGHKLYKCGQEGKTFHILAQGEVEVFRDGQKVARLGTGTSVGEMAYLAPSPDLRKHTTDVVVSDPCTTISFTPSSLGGLSAATKHQFDHAFIQVLVRRLHAAHEALAHPRRIL
jgi:eukaryotic-like serine/threonine-protein kinase